MRLDVFAALSVGSTLVLAGAAPGQQPAPSPAAPPTPPADYGPPITNEQAKAVAAAAVAEARKNNSPMAVAIVGPAGDLVYFEKMDGTQLASIEISQGKARTAVMFRRPSRAFADQYAGRNRAFMTFPEKPIASKAAFRSSWTARSSVRSAQAVAATSEDGATASRQSSWRQDHAI